MEAQPASADAALRSSLNILRRLPPASVPTNLMGLAVLRQDLTEELLQRVDQPLQSRVCPVTQRKFLMCDYNRDGDAWRSPFSNTYDPPGEGEVFPSTGLRQLEIACNELLDTYAQLYYAEGGAVLTSAYFWDSGPTFAACWLIQKLLGGPSASRSVSAGVTSAQYDAIHVFQVSQVAGAANTFKYGLTTSVLLSTSMVGEGPSGCGNLQLAGSLTRSTTSTAVVSPEKGHLVHMGTLMEGAEGELRTSMEALVLDKHRQILSGLRRSGPSNGLLGSGARGGMSMSPMSPVAGLAAAIQKRAAVADA